ncbi:MAG: hypothetical protein QNK03_08935 [Myxococcota bacterium]|nr:hypothetical protein [Myxococcota bacterium]
MTLRAALWLAVPLATLLGCEPGAWWRASGVRTFEEVEVGEALRAWDGSDGLLVQVRDPDARLLRVAGARLLDPGEPLPEALSGGGKPVTIVAADVRDARRLAARIVRSGSRRVSVVRGGIEAWLAESPGAAETPKAAHHRAGTERET